jgi:hypothetical protein
MRNFSKLLLELRSFVCSVEKCYDMEAVFKPIRKGGCYKSDERINLYLRLLFCCIIGLYDKRWYVETP